MDRRFIAWLLFTASLFLLWTTLRPQFAPDEVKPINNDPVAQSENSNKTETGEVTRLDPAIGAKEDPTETSAGADSHHFLGSFQPEDGFRLGVTVSSRGAGIERIELVEQTKPGRFRYRSLEGETGYLGYLSLLPVKDGLLVRSVPTGSPAALAKCDDPAVVGGLQVGDTITRVDEKPVQSLADWHQIFRKVKPGHMAEIKLQRGPADAPQSLVFETKLIQAPMDVVRMVDDKINEEVVGNFMKESCLTTLAKIDKASIPVGQKSIQGLEQIMNGYWEPRPLDVPNGAGIEFVLSLDGWLAKAGIPAKLELVKQYRLTGAITGDAAKQPKGYELDMKVTVRNRDDVAHQVAFRQHCFNGLTLEGWWYLTKISPFMFEGAGSRDVVYGSKELGHNMVTRRSIFSAAKSNPKDPDQLFLSAAPNQKRSLKYLGIDGQFFAAAILPHPEQSDGLSDIQQAATSLLASPSAVEPKQMAANVGAWFDTSVATIEPNQEWSKQFTLFAGPKDPQVLDKYGLGSLLEYGWFGWVAKPLTLLLHSFYAVARNYGIAIVMLTVLVRSIMFPFSRRAAINAQKMQEVAPELKRINELYKDDWEKRTKATQEVYKKAQFNPMAGCMPLFIQLPIFIGLYRAVSLDIDLRQQPLIPGIDWCSNLAGPDMLLEWSSWMPDFIAGKGTGWFGPYLNLLPIFTITLFIIQQKVLMPKATDEQQQMTQTMMMYMTVFMGVLFFKVPAGLCIYFITSSTWSLVERQLVKRMLPKTTPNLAMAGAAPAKGPVVDVPASKTTPANKPFKGARGAVSTPRSQRPEKLSDVFPWFSRFEGKTPEEPKGDPKPSSGPSHRKKRKN